MAVNDLAQGLLSTSERLLVSHAQTDVGETLLHSNQVVEAAATGALPTRRVWTDSVLNPSTTLRELRCDHDHGARPSA